MDEPKASWSGPPGAGLSRRKYVRAVVWAQSGQAARMLVEWDTTDRFGNARRVSGPVTGPEADHTAKVVLAGLPAGQRVFYRVRFEDRQWVAGDTCGQGWRIDESRGGLRTYESIRRAEPQFFVHSGDTIYADNSMAATAPWRMRARRFGRCCT